MDLRALLESEHSSAVKDRVVRYIGADQKRFDALVRLFMDKNPLVAQRAAWPLGEVGEREPRLAVKHTGAMLRKLDDRAAHPAVARNIMRIFQQMDIPEAQCGPVLDAAYRFLKSATAAPAIRAYAITVAGNICKRYPEMMQELNLVLRELLKLPQPPAVRVRIKKALGHLPS